MSNTQSQHTPGPWEVVGGEIIAADYIGKVYDHSNPNCSPKYEKENQALRKRHEANARLIAAAPELLAALESLASDFRTTTRDCDKWNGYIAAVQAIAKAKGVPHE